MAGMLAMLRLATRQLQVAAYSCRIHMENRCCSCKL